MSQKTDYLSVSDIQAQCWWEVENSPSKVMETTCVTLFRQNNLLNGLHQTLRGALQRRAKFAFQHSSGNSFHLLLPKSEIPWKVHHYEVMNQEKSSIDFFSEFLLYQHGGIWVGSAILKFSTLENTLLAIPKNLQKLEEILLIFLCQRVRSRFWGLFLYLFKYLINSCNER